MKNKNSIVKISLPLILAVCLYVVFYSKITSKPDDAGFWFIFVLGMSFGVTFIGLINYFKK